MRSLILVFLVALGCSGNPSANPAGPSAEPAPAAAARYTCPMHPEIVSDKPGNCPKCGKPLVPVEAR